jgi:hypothetical protein
MKKNLRNFFLCLSATLLVSACASKQKVAYGPGLPEPQTPSVITEADSANSSQDLNLQVPGKAPVERPRVTLVVGGSGVASFGTVGLLKRFSEEGIRVDAMIATGWPSLFALGFGFLKTVHDLEWFALRLDAKDFQTASLLRGRNEISDHVSGKLKAATFEESRVPIVISTRNPETGELDVFDRGDWKEPLLITLAASDIGEAEKASKPLGIDVKEAFRRESKIVVAVQMYDDVLFSSKAAKGTPRGDFYKALKEQLVEDSQQAQVAGRVTLGKSPEDFTQKRAAILAGYREGARLAKKIRGLLGNANRSTP